MASLPEGWFYATPEEQKSLWQELKKELPEGHLLFNKSVQVIAHRDGATDDILCQHLDEPNRSVYGYPFDLGYKTRNRCKIPLGRGGRQFCRFYSLRKQI